MTRYILVPIARNLRGVDITFRLSGLPFCSALTDYGTDQMTASETDLWVLRDGKKAVSGRKLLQHLRTSLATLCRSPRDSGAQSTALIQAGEIEAALADVNSPAAVFFAKLTDAVAALALGDCDTASFACLACEVESQHVPESLTISPPEGFTYYALQP